MTFLQNGLLWFLVLALIPIILYLLFRRRRNEVDWGATYVLRLALASGRRQTLWKQLLVIALRTLLLLLLILAFARPFLARGPDEMGGDLPHGLGTLHRIVLIDNSLSMNAQHGLGTRMDEAREALALLLSTLQAGDTAHLVPMCRSRDEEILAQELDAPMSWNDAVQVAGSVEVRGAPLDMATALRVAVERFRQGAANNRQLVIMTDLSRGDHPELADYEMFGKMLTDLQVRVAVLNLGERDRLNLALDGAGVGTERLLAGQPTNAYVEVVNFSDIPSEDGHLRFIANGELVGEQPCILAPGQRRRYRFEVTLPEGEHVFEARLNDDAYPADNRVERFVRAESVVRVLLVTPAESKAEGFEAPGAFLERALSAAPEMPFRFAVESLPTDRLIPGSFARADVVVLCDPERLNESLREELAGFVRRGGGLLIGAGATVEAEVLNRHLGNLTPARLEEPFRPEFDAERYQEIQASEIGLPMLREFETALNGDLGRARIYNHWLVSPVEEAEVVLRLNNGDPLLLHRAFGQGRVILWATSLGGAWSSLPVRQAYLPFIYRVLTWAGGFGRAARNVQPDEPLIAAIPEGRESAYLTTPGAELREVEIRSGDGRAFVRIDDSSQPGTYDLRDGERNLLARFSVAMPLAESDLRLLEEEELQRLTTILDGRLAANRAELGKALWREGDGREQAAWLLIAVFSLFILDALATRFFFS